MQTKETGKVSRRKWLINRWVFFKENNPTAHICVLIVVVNLIFILCAAVLISFLPENQGRSIGATVRLAFTLMVNPSGKYTYSEAPCSLVITTIVVLMGMVSITGGTVGFITNIINSFVEETAKSERSLKLRDHIVILNYNQRVPSILADYCFDDVKSTYIVILADQNQDLINRKVNEMFDKQGCSRRFRNVIVRTGNPMSPLDLERIALSEAKTVLLMAPESDRLSQTESAFALSKLFMFVTGYLGDGEGDCNTNVLVETMTDDMAAMIQRYRMLDSGRTAVSVPYNKVIGKILGVTTIMPSINDVLRQLFSFEGVEVYTENNTNGLTIAEELKRNCSALPLFDRSGTRVYVAENEKELTRFRDEPFVLQKPLPTKPFTPKLSFSKTEILIVGINKKLPYILESLCCFKQEYQNEQLHVILADTAEKQCALEAIYADARYCDILMPNTYHPIIIQNIYRPMDALRELVNSTASTVLFLSDDTTNSCVDEKPLLYWVDIHQKMESAQCPDMVVELQDPDNQSIIKRRAKEQILVSDDFLGHLYAQLGKNPSRMNVIMDMITSEGDTVSGGESSELQNECDLLCLRAGSFFAGSGCDMTFASKRELIVWVYEATGGRILPIGCTKEGETYLFARTDNKKTGLDSSVLLGMTKGQQRQSPDGKITLNPEDELVVCVLSAKN